MKLTSLIGAAVLTAMHSLSQNVYENYAFRTVAGAPPGGVSVDGSLSDARFNGVNSVTVDRAGNIYAADTASHSIRRISSAGVTTVAGIFGVTGSADGTGDQALFNRPFFVTMDEQDRIVIADTFNHTIRRMTAAGQVTTLAGLAGDGQTVNGTGKQARFNYPAGVGVDAAGNIYVADTQSHVIRKITPNLVVTTIAGLAYASGSADGTGAAARFNQPYGLAAMPDGTVYVADKANHIIRRISSSGVVTTLAGFAGAAGSSDGVEREARFFNPYGVAVDGAGNVYVGDRDNQLVRKITPEGRVTTLGGGVVAVGSADGRGAAARFNKPCGLAVAADGKIYIADLLNNTVRVGYPLTLWQPRVTGSTTSFGLGILDGERVVIETSSDLANWTAISTNTMSIDTRFEDVAGFSAAQNKFYRALIR